MRPPKNCEWCGNSWAPFSSKARTCSPKCRARLREVEKPSRGAPRREYDAELVRNICDLYASGMTIAEIQRSFAGVKVQLVLERHLASRRKAVIRSQRREENANWKGDAASYSGFHARLYRERGRPSICEMCGATEGRFEWANQTGAYEDMNDYRRLCVTCHRNFDSARRRETGRLTAPTRR